MSIQKAVDTVIQARGLEDYYSLLIATEAIKPEATEKAITQLMYDIMLGVTSNE